MNTLPCAPSTRLLPLAGVWLMLVMLTLLSPGLGDWLHGSAALPWLVAAIIWLKGWLICRHFIESGLTHPFIRRVLDGFILVTPVALVLIALFGPQFARWATL